MKRKLLCGLLAALTLTCATVKAAPSRVVPVQVDGTVLSQGVNYLQSGVTYVPLRGLLDAFGGWSVCGDSSRKGGCRRLRQPVRHRKPVPKYRDGQRPYIQRQGLCGAWPGPTSPCGTLATALVAAWPGTPAGRRGG